MFNTSWKLFDRSHLKRMRDAPDKMSNRMIKFIRKKVRPLVSLRVDERLRVAPPPRNNSMPLKWTSEEQRRAFFATGGFGYTIPYKRTGKGIKSWRVRGNYYKQSANIFISTTDPAQEFITGPRQQFFHTATGWPVAEDVVRDIWEEAMSEMNSFWLKMTGEIWEL